MVLMCQLSEFRDHTIQGGGRGVCNHIFSFQTLQMSSTQTCNTVFPTLCQLRIYSSRDQNSKIHQIQTGFCAQVSNPAFCLICASCTRVFVFSCRTDNSSLPAFHSDCNLWSLQDVSLSAHTASQLQWKPHLHCAARVRASLRACDLRCARG